MNRFRRLAWRVAAAALLGCAALSNALAQSNVSAESPFTKAARVESLRLPAGSAATVVSLEPPAASVVDAVRQANALRHEKRLQIGIARAVTLPEAASSALAWQAVPGGFAAQWQVVSPGARALRVGLDASRLAPGTELRFAGVGAPDTVYGPATAKDLVPGGPTYWSPVLEGPRATIEVFVPGTSAPSALALAITQVSHLIVSPADPKAESLAKAAGFCEVDLICRSASDPELAQAGRAVARMTFVDTGTTYLCTGTLLNPLDNSFTPYFYSANHCISTQTVASTLSTYWFYDATACGSGTPSPLATQLTGGATLLYADAASDGLLLRLNATPPSGAVYAGWDASTASVGTPATAIHHPAGDLKKVSLGTIGGFGNPDTPGLTNYLIVNWNSVATGVTEGGSSGSGIFINAGAGYQLRGGLYGGPSSCTASGSSLRDYYSRFDQVYPSIAAWLNPTSSASPNYTSLWWNPNESGWGLNVNQQGDIVFATLFTYDTDGTPMWLVLARGERQGGADTFSGTLYRTTGPRFDATPFPSSQVVATPVGTMSVAFSGNNGSLTYTVNGVTVSKTIQKEAFPGSTPAVCSSTSGDRSGLTNYQDLWWNPNEPGWGINLTQQSDVIFGTLFTYDANGHGVWLALSHGAKQADGSYSGSLYEGTGPAFNANPFNPSQVVSNVVGSMQVRFASGTSGTLTYTYNGIPVTKSIVREVFSNPVPACTG